MELVANASKCNIFTRLNCVKTYLLSTTGYSRHHRLIELDAHKERADAMLFGKKKHNPRKKMYFVAKKTANCYKMIIRKGQIPISWVLDYKTSPLVQNQYEKNECNYLLYYIPAASM